MSDPFSYSFDPDAYMAGEVETDIAVHLDALEAQIDALEQRWPEDMAALHWWQFIARFQMKRHGKLFPQRRAAIERMRHNVLRARMAGDHEWPRTAP